MIRVAIIEDQPACAARLQELFASTDDLECVACCTSPAEAVAEIPGRHPDVVLVDVFLADGEIGHAAIGPLRESLPEAEFVMLTRTGDYDQIFASILAGANGYLLKTETDDRIVRAVRAMHAHESFMTNSIARKVMQAFREMAARHSQSTAVLTTKEEDILRLVERGKQYKEVAEHLEISVRTIHSHIRNIYKKLQASNKHEALQRWRGLSGTADHVP